MRQLIEELQQAAGQHRPAQHHDRRIEIRREEQREADHCDVQQGRHEGRHREAVPGVEDRAGQGRQRDQQYIRKGHPQQVGGQGELFRGIGEARSGDPDNPGRGEDAERRDQRQHQREQAGNVGDEGPRRLLALLVLVLCQDRHESLGKRPLGEDPPQQVGQLEGDEKGVGGEAGTEDPRQDGIADEAEDPRQHGDGTHRRQ